MPLNEAGGVARSNLTKQQKAEAIAAIYGVPLPETERTMTPSTQQFSEADFERMRQLLHAHDKQSGGANEFDLAKPPVKPYRHQEHPKLVYDHENRTHMQVNSPAEEESAIARGWKAEPFPAEEPESEVELDPATAAEVAAVDKKIAEAKAKRAKKK